MEGNELFVMLPLWYVVFLLAVTCHEAAHAWAARLGGDETAYLGGQVSLNPVPHVLREPFGAALVPLLTFYSAGGSWMMGWASAPYDPGWEERHPRRAAAMAAAGPAANLVLALLAFAVLKGGIAAEVWSAPLQGVTPDRLVTAAGVESAAFEGLGRMCSIMLVLNLVLFVFNLFPLPPLDGAAVLAGLWPPARTVRDRIRRTSLGPLAGLLIAWLLFDPVFKPVYRWVVVDMLWGG